MRKDPKRKPIFTKKFIEIGCLIDPEYWASLADLYEMFLIYYQVIPKPPRRPPDSKIMFSKDLVKLGFLKKRGRKRGPAGPFNGVYFEGLTPK